MSDEEGDETYAMKQMMGFSSFGTSQRPKKEPQEPPSGAFSASGANSAPIAKRAKTSNTTRKIPPLSSSPPTFWPASLPPQPKSAASFGTISSVQSYRTAIEQQPPPPGASLTTQDLWSAPPLIHALPTYSPQDAWYAPPAPGVLPSTPVPVGRYAPPGPLSAPPMMQDCRYPAVPGVSVPSQSPHEGSGERAPGPPAYVDPVSGISLTRQELSELRSGKKNGQGDVVYFQPSFVDPDPWAGLKRGGGRVGN